MIELVAFSDNELMLRESVRQFLEKELEPIVE